MVLVTAALLLHCAKALRRLWWIRLPVYATPVVVGRRLRGDAWCGMQLSTPQFWGVLHKPRIGIVPDPFLVKAVWLRETRLQELKAVIVSRRLRVCGGTSKPINYHRGSRNAGPLHQKCERYAPDPISAER